MIKNITILFLLFWGVENVWACTGDIGHNIAFNDCHFYFNPYYNESNTVNQGYIQLAARKYQYNDCDTWGWYTGVTTLNNVTNTRLYYASSLEGTAWGDSYKKFDGWAMISNSDDKKNGGTEYWKSGNSTWYSEYKNYGLNSNKTYLFQASSSSNGQTIETTSASGYLENGWSALNKTITVKAKISIDNGGNYSEATSPGVLTASSYKFTAHNTCTTSTSLSSEDITCGYTATTTLTAPSTDPTGYTWVGWYDASGTRKTTSKTLTIYPTEDATYYAYYKANQYTGTIDKNDGAADKSYTATYNVGTLTIATAPSRTGYSLSGYYEEDACTHLIANAFKTLQNSTTYTNSSGKWTYTSAPKIYAGWTVNTYTITLNHGTGGSGSGTMTIDYDATGYKTWTSDITQTGYHINGWYDNGESLKVLNDNGTFAASDVTGYITSGKWSKASDCTLQAWWDPNNYTVTLDVDEDHQGSIAGATTIHTVTFNTITTTIPNRPTAEQGYGLDGYYTDHNGAGTKLINGNGTFIASMDGYTDGDAKWIHDGGVTLYAYYKKSEITGLAFDASIVAPSATVYVTPTISPAPAGSTTICWRVLYANGNPLASQPSFTWNEGKVRFPASETSGTYLIEARLRKGSGCEGEVLDSVTAPFQVAGDHTVTVQYKCGDDFIQASTSVTGKPLEWTEVVAHDIFGYTYSSMTAGDGITLRDTTAARLVELQAADPTIVAVKRMKANYDGKLTINYVQNDMIYFKNTLGWSSVYVNFLDGDYWTADKGTGNQSKDHCNLSMTRIGESDVWYYDYGAASITPTKYIAFTQESMLNYKNFYQTSPNVAHVVYPSRSTDALGTDKKDGLGFYAKTPMFVPRKVNESDGVLQNDDRARYYNDGYWTKYTPGTGYSLEIYYSDGTTLRTTIPFTSSDELMPMEAVADLEANYTYKIRLKRDGDVNYTNGANTMTYNNHGQATAWEFNQGDAKTTGITTNAAGNYTFNLSFSGNASNEYRLRIAAEYPIAAGYYRVIYDDAVQTNYKASAIIANTNNSKDTVSFFVRPNNTPVMKIQKASINGEGVVSWGNDVAITSYVSSLTKDSVYNICLTINGEGAISVENVVPYTGNYYIRTDCANSKWSNYRSDPDHLMNYSEYSISHGGYSHYYTHWVNKDDAGRKNVKFCVANDYSPSISDTLIRETASGTWAKIADYIEAGGDIKRSANVRFMWNRHDNTISRAYIDGAQDDLHAFLELLSSDSKIKDKDGDVLTQVTFSDKENWIYEANIKAQPEAQIKLKSTWGETNVIEQYFKGSSGSTETLIGGSGSDWYTIRLLYDFKTNRLIAALTPSSAIGTSTAINADVMFVRDHHGDINQLTFSGSGDLHSITTAYGIMQFNKWTLNNLDRSSHTALATPASIYERCLYWVSFPFKVKLSEVFGFGTYGEHWIIQYYDGAERAEKGYWAESGSFWKPVWDRTDFMLEPNTGYLLTLAVDEGLFATDKTDIWGPTSRSEQIELYFPSYGTMPTISSSTATYKLPSHKCTIDRTKDQYGNPTGLPSSYNRTIADSHWNVMSVPTYVNTSNISYATTSWIANDSCPNFIYTWNANDNTLTATSSSEFMFHAMHAYMVQYYGNVRWSSSVSPYNPIVARRTYAEMPQEVEFCVELQQDDQMIDRTYIRMSDDEEASAGFVFGEDMSKTLNQGKANIYSFIGSEPAAGNTLPSTDQTTLVPMGVKIATAGTYTISIPTGTYGIGVTLIDEQTGVRTSLSAMDYIVELDADDYTNRFFLEIAPIKTMPTDIENVQGDNVQGTKARKIMIDGILYIRKDGKIYDARGVRIQ